MAELLPCRGALTKGDETFPGKVGSERGHSGLRKQCELNQNHPLWKMRSLCGVGWADGEEARPKCGDPRR